MTAQARRVLADCRTALQLLEEETDLQRWRIHWVAALALIGAVGHVLDKVDSRDLKVSTATRAAHKRWKTDEQEHEIFREFIERERNNILKEYEFNTHPSAQVAIALIGALRRVSDCELTNTAEIIPIGENIYRSLVDGFRARDDARDVFSDAIDWWDRQLTAIEQSIF